MTEEQGVGPGARHSTPASLSPTTQCKCHLACPALALRMEVISRHRLRITGWATPK